MSTVVLSEKNLKEKWLRNYQEEIFMNKEKREIERMKKLLEEKEYLEKIRQEMEEENRRKFLKKQNLMIDNQYEINKYLNKKRLEEERNINEKISDQASLSLPIQHEERVENYKNMINKLQDKIDNNMNNYKQYNDNFNQRNDGNNSNNNRNSNQENDKFTNEINQTGQRNMENMYNNDQKYYENYHENTKSPSKNDNEQYIYNNRYPNQQENYGRNSPTDDKGFLDNVFYKDASDYRNVVKDYLNYNKELMDNKIRNKSHNFQKRRQIDDERLKEADRIRRLKEEEKYYFKEQQKIYKEILDGQVKTKVFNGLTNPYYQTNNNHLNTYKDNNLYYPMKPEMKSNLKQDEYINDKGVIPNLLYNNDYDKKFNLGNTQLNHNPILNPVPNFKYNKYLYRDSAHPYNQTNNVNLSSSLRFTGNSIIS